MVCKCRHVNVFTCSVIWGCDHREQPESRGTLNNWGKGVNGTDLNGSDYTLSASYEPGQGVEPNINHDMQLNKTTFTDLLNML